MIFPLGWFIVSCMCYLYSVIESGIKYLINFHDDIKNKYGLQVSWKMRGDAKCVH